VLLGPDFLLTKHLITKNIISINMNLKSKILIKEKLKKNQKLLALWAADCAEHVLPFFEKEYPEDDRPKIAIEAARAWVHDEIKVGEARKAAVATHTAARNTNNVAARAAARAAGHAAGTAHMAGHAPHAANYAIVAAEAVGITRECEWQYRHLPKNLKSLIKKMRVWKISS